MVQITRGHGWGMAASIATLLLLAGCSAEPNTPARSVGDCWMSATESGGTLTRSLDVQATVCDRDALSYTYLVETISGADSSDYLAEGVIDAKTVSDLPKVLGTTILQSCESELVRQLNVSVKALRSARLVWGFTLPTADEFNAGAHWYSCELSVYASGSSLTNPKWLPLTRGLESVTQLIAADDFALCVQSATNQAGPFTAASEVTPCAGDVRWQLKQVPLEIRTGKPYPGLTVALATVRELCSAAYPEARALEPNPLKEIDWYLSTPTAGCWVSTILNLDELETEREAERLAQEEAEREAARSNTRPRPVTPTPNPTEATPETPTPAPTDPTEGPVVE